MTTTYVTPGTLPIEAFTTFGLNSKPNTDNPIGHFGTGLKYAVAVIMRNGGTVRLFIGETEYVFYTKDTDFRGKSFYKVRMKKRRGLLSRWTYEDLPFTTELGKEWGLWQAHRELESNTRDENGTTHNMGAEDIVAPDHSMIQIDCPGFDEIVARDDTFLDMGDTEPLFEFDAFKIYDAPSQYIYYRGVRVYDLRYPARFTYDFNKGHVKLSEDRSASNIWSMMWDIAHAFMIGIDDEEFLQKALESGSDKHFEGHDLTFGADTYGVTSAFKTVARRLSMKGFATATVGAYYNYVSRPRETASSVKLELDEWRVIVDLLNNNGRDDIADKITCEISFDED